MIGMKRKGLNAVLKNDLYTEILQPDICGKQKRPDKLPGRR